MAENAAPPPLARDIALRVGLAARALQGVSPAQMLDVLDRAAGLPLDAAKLDGLTVKALRRAGGEPLLSAPPDDIRTALARLKGGDGETAAPEIDAYEDGDMPGSLRVACASNGAERLDGHFGSCSQFLIYQVSPDAVRLVDIRRPDEDADHEIEVDRNTRRAAMLADCQILYVVSIGGPPAARVVRAGVHPIKRPGGGDARAVASELQAVLTKGAPPWLSKILAAADVDPADRANAALLTPATLDAIAARISSDGADEAILGALREAWPHLHFTWCLDDDIGDLAPWREENGFSLYLVAERNGCLAVTRSPEAATGLVVACHNDRP